MVSGAVWGEPAEVLTEAQAAPEKVSKWVHHGPEFQVTRTDRHCECRVWPDSTELCFHSANLKSLFPSQLNQDLRGRCLSSKLLSKAAGSGFLGAEPAQEAAMGGGGRGRGSGHRPDRALREPSFRHRTAREALW